MAGKRSDPSSGKRGGPSALVGCAVAGAGAGLAVLVAGVTVYFVFFAKHDEPPPVPPPPPLVENPTPPPPVDPIRPAKVEMWWDAVPGSRLSVTASLLKQVEPKEEFLFDQVGDKSNATRRDAYQELIAKLPDLMANPKTKMLLPSLLADCYALDPTDKNVAPLGQWMVAQFPKENTEFLGTYTQDDLERSMWALHISMETLANQSQIARVKNLGEDISKTLGFAIEPGMTRAELIVRAEKLLALRCYRNLVPTAAKSVDHALTIRDMFSRNEIADKLSPTSRGKIDLEIAFHGLPAAKSSWPAYSKLLRDCLTNADAGHDLEIVALYGRADADTAGMMEPILATKWNGAFKDGSLPREAKIRAVQRILGIPEPIHRPTQLAKVARATLANASSPVRKPNAVLQETARFTHASTLACALLNKETGEALFDALIAQVPELEPDDVPMPMNKDDKKQPDPKQPIDTLPGAKAGPIHLKGTLTAGAYSQVHSAPLKRGRTYSISMLSSFDNFLRLQNSKGVHLAQDDDGGAGTNARIVFTPPYDDNFRVVATSAFGRAVGPYAITIEEGLGFGMAPPPGAPFPFPFPGKRLPLRFRFPPPGFPGMPPVVMPGQPQVAIPGQKDKVPGDAPPKASTPAGVDDADVANLSQNNAKSRLTAIQSISTKMKADGGQIDLTPKQARIIAKYVLTKHDDSEVDEIVANLPPLAKSRNLMIATADQLESDAADQRASEAVIAALLGHELEFAKDTWRQAWRKLLLAQAVEMSDTAGAASEAADILRELYAEQAILLGMVPDDFKAITRPSQVIEALTKHVANKIDKNSLAKEDRDYLAELPRRFIAAQFVAQDDLEHTALAQRVWIRVLALYLEQQFPQRAEALREVHADLRESDRGATNSLEQLRAGEERILRVWTVALELK